MKNSKLTSFSPAMDQNGNHRSWNSERFNKTYWVFNVQFANGDFGQANSTSQQPSWSINSEYEYNLDIKQTQYGEQRNVKGMKKPGSGEGYSGGKSRQIDPSEQKKIINQVAMIGANSVMNKLQEEYAEVYKQFRDWLYNKIFVLKEHPIQTQGVFKIACDYFDRIPVQETTIKDVLDRAHALLHNSKRTEWTDPNLQQSNMPQSNQPTVQPADQLPQNQPQEQQPQSSPGFVTEDPITM